MQCTAASPISEVEDNPQSSCPHFNAFMVQASNKCSAGRHRQQDALLALSASAVTAGYAASVDVQYIALPC
ncbi:MAG: hypothetical protein FRX49_10235 [Trebouxia sp. A1-2]|nr:MAG: hypothetical protein FRX49_10235 [Trebouxia sp. A1-2]